MFFVLFLSFWCKTLVCGFLHRTVGPCTDTATSITYSGLVNFTNKDPTGPASGNCLINSLVYNEAQPLQEVLGEVTQLDVDNIDQHPYHHHIQPYQIVALPNDSDAFNSLWRVSSSYSSSFVFCCTCLQPTCSRVVCPYCCGHQLCICESIILSAMIMWPACRGWYSAVSSVTGKSIDVECELAVTSGCMRAAGGRLCGHSAAAQQRHEDRHCALDPGPRRDHRYINTLTANGPGHMM